MRSSRGYTLVEFLVVIAILVLIATLTFKTYISFKGSKTLEAAVSLVLAELKEARSLSINGKNGNEWGVHVASTSVTLFEGSTYNASASSNIVSAIDSSVQISAISLYGGSADVVFSRLKGTTQSTGTITLSLVASTTQTKTVRIYATGLSQKQ